MASIVARIRLAEGQSGFYDELSGIVLNWSHPTANVKLGTDVSRLRKALKHHKIRLVEGSLGTSKTFKQVLMEAKSRRTGIDLKTLMGKTPLAEEPTTVIDSDDDLHKDTVVDTIEADAPKVAVAEEEPKKTAAEPVVAVEDVKPEQMTTTPKSVRSLKVGATKEITLSHPGTASVADDSKELVSVEMSKDNMSFVITGLAAGSATINITPNVKMVDGTTLSVKVVEA